MSFNRNTFVTGLGEMIPGLAGMFGNFKNPYESGMPELDKIPGMLKEYYQPYTDVGKRALPGLESQYGNLTMNPGQFMNQLGEGYQQSPGFNFQKQQAEQAASHAAAAGGMAGTPQHEQQIADMISQLSSRDYGDWMSRALGAYQTGLGGQQGLANMGFGATNELSQGLGNTMMTKALMAMMGQNMQNQQEGGELGSLLSGGLKLGSAFFGL